MSTETSAPASDSWLGRVYDDQHAGVITFAADGRSIPWRRILDSAASQAGGLRRLGVRPGERVATVLTNDPASVTGLLALWLAGAVPMSMPLRSSGLSDAVYRAQLEGVLRRSSARLLFADGSVSSLAAGLELPAEVVAWQEVPLGPSTVDPGGATEIAFAQCSSGSTGAAKACALTADAIGHQLDMVQTLMAAERGQDKVVSWLPLSHDMGLFGCLLYSLSRDLDMLLSSPERFGRAPGSWLGDCVETGATLTAGTSTALRLATRIQRRRQIGNLPLRAVVLGAEQVYDASINDLVAAVPDGTLRRSHFLPAYGMAEATLAVTGARTTNEPRVLHLSTSALEAGDVVAAAPAGDDSTTLVSAGAALPGAEVRIVDDRPFGEIVVRSASLANGYLGDPARTAERFRDGAFYTGDLGLIDDSGELFVVGRTDDMLSVGGRNIYAREIEQRVDELADVRSGGTVMVEVGNGTELAMLVELRRSDCDLSELARRVSGAALASSGVSPNRCVFLPGRALPRTASGKVQRRRAALLYETDGLPVVDVVAFT